MSPKNLHRHCKQLIWVIKRVGKAPATQRSSINHQGDESNDNRTLQILSTAPSLLIGDTVRWKPTHTFTCWGFPFSLLLDPASMWQEVALMTIPELSKAQKRLSFKSINKDMECFRLSGEIIHISEALHLCISSGTIFTSSRKIHFTGELFGPTGRNHSAVCSFSPSRG